jgi:FkbM family methyltransferase
MPKIESYGFKPSLARRTLRIVCKTIIGALRLNGSSKFSNEFIQLLDPKIEIKFEGQSLKFRTGNGRLLWRAQTILTEEPLMITWINSLSKDDIVLDIGANVGMYTVPMAKKVKNVYACELDPLNIAILKENLFLNSILDKVIILPFACGGSADVVNVKFRDLAYGDALQLIEGGDSQDTRFGSKTHTSSVLQFSLDDLFTLLKLKQPNKIKIDVDGNEHTVLQGTKRLISGANEIYFEDSMSDACREVTDFLTISGFRELKNLNMISKNNKNEIVGVNRIFKK